MVSVELTARWGVLVDQELADFDAEAAREQEEDADA